MKLEMVQKKNSFMNMKGPLFYAKILLFGEYGIIKDSKGLSIPYNSYKGGLKTKDFQLNDAQKKSHQIIKKFISFIKSIDSAVIDFDWKKINIDIENKIFFESDIPQRYGVGSSGALVASIYDRYAINKIDVSSNLTNNKLQKLKYIFSMMESYFHGKSSGLDPLNSYLGVPILIKSNNNIESPGIPSQDFKGSGAVFLLDSGFEGDTAPMVDLFMRNMKNESYSKIIKEDFISVTDKCVDNFLSGSYKNLFDHLKELSKIVFNNFNPMIPDVYKDIWLKGINSNAYYLKLCGSGGGGYILGFTKNLNNAKKLLNGHDLQVVYHF